MIFAVTILFAISIGLSVASKTYGHAAWLFVFWLGWMIDKLCDAIRSLKP